MLHSFYKSLAFLITFIIFNSLGLTTVRPNELSDSPKERLRQRMVNSSKVVDVNPSDWSFRSFQSIVKRYDCLSASTETSFDGIHQIDRAKFARDLNSCTDRIKDLVGIAPADLEILQQLQVDKNRYANASFRDFSTAAITNNLII